MPAPKSNPITPEMCEPLWRDEQTVDAVQRENARVILNLIPKIYSDRLSMTEMG